MQQQNKLAKSREKIQIKWGVELFAAFVSYAARQGIVSPSQTKMLLGELGELGKAVLGDDSAESITNQLNHYIGVMNAQMKQNMEPAKYSPFPIFSIAMGEHIQSAVLDQLDMVERTLTEAAHAKIIDWDKESEYFINLLKVFSSVENKKMRPQEAIAYLLAEIKKINNLLPSEFTLPELDLSAYE